jgi:hypothetical protein
MRTRAATVAAPEGVGRDTVLSVRFSRCENRRTLHGPSTNRAYRGIVPVASFHPTCSVGHNLPVHPIIDEPRAAPDGLVVATGFDGLGVMISPVVGEVVRELVTGRSASFSIAPFGLGRFDVKSTDFSL